MKFFKKIFGNNKNQKPHNFSKIMKNRHRLVIFLTENHYESFKIVVDVAGFQSDFKEIIFFIDQYSYPFFAQLELAKKMNFRIFDREQPIFPEAVIMNFTDEKNVRAFLKRCNDSTIIDINNEANMQFLPTAKSSLELFERFCEFYRIEIKKQELKLPISNQEIVITKQRFSQNRFPNFILEISPGFSSRNLENLIKMFKQNFSANVYLSDKVINTKDLINIAAIQKKDLLELFLLAKSSDLFITNKEEIAKLFAKMGENVIFLGDDLPEKNAKCFKMKDQFKMKGFIQDYLKHNKDQD